MLNFSNIVPNFCEADLTSFRDGVYTRPVLVRGSTMVKTSFIAIVIVSSDDGYLNEFAGPGGCKFQLNLTFIWT